MIATRSRRNCSTTRRGKCRRILGLRRLFLGGTLLLCSWTTMTTTTSTLTWAYTPLTWISTAAQAPVWSHRGRSPRAPLSASPGADIEQPPLDDNDDNDQNSRGRTTASKPLVDPIITNGFGTRSTTDTFGTTKTPTLPTRTSTTSSLSPPRGKVNEIDFCIAPADVSLSRAYGKLMTTTAAAADAPTLSLTRALNNASNRAVRRILLARSWPSAEALNVSLRRVAQAERQQQQEQQNDQQKSQANGNDNDIPTTTSKCPVPQPILNVLTRKSRRNANNNNNNAITPPQARSRTDAEYVADQLQSFRARYGELVGYEYAHDYLEAVLSLATTGIESARSVQVLQDGIYDESYKRVLAVLNTVGVKFTTDPETGRRAIADLLVDQDISLSMLDKIRIQQEERETKSSAALSDLLSDNKEGDDDVLTNQDLGGVLLSAKEPSMTRQLNVLSNIAQRALLFGGDQELLVLAETLDADRQAFVERWYPDTGGVQEDLVNETRPGIQYLNNVIQLLRNCYTNGMVNNLDPPLPLLKSYANAYERLVATAVELGSGYLKPVASDRPVPIPRNAKEELGRFALWESNFRQSTPDVSCYPEDLEGSWEVRDEIGGETIGLSTVVLKEQGSVEVALPMEGLRWRLDPGPTHLDTCTFQVLSNDGTILQYRGFIDRGARLEARFSKRPLRIRGSVQFQMRDGSIDYYKDMLPINYRQGTTKFVMTKILGEGPRTTAQ